jgi:hypothetical protein
LLCSLALGCALFGSADRDDAIEDLIRLQERHFGTAKFAALRDECIPNMRAIKTAQLSYDASFDTYVEVSSFHPDSAPGKTQREFTTGSAFDTIGWRPDGLVRGSYKVASTSTTDFLITCITDVDGDGAKASFTATKTLNVTLNTRNDVY